MYAKPTLYKVYAIILLAVVVLAVITSLTIVINSFFEHTDFEQFKSLVFDYGGMNNMNWTLRVFVLVVFLILVLLLLLGVVAVTLLFAYVSFSSLFAFSDMIVHELSGSTEAMRKRNFVLSPKFYRGFGYAVFIVVFILSLLSAVVLIISDSVSNRYLICLPFFPLLIMAANITLIYISIYLKNKAIGDLLELATKKKEERSNNLLNDLKQTKINFFRAYCVFMVICCAVAVVSSIVLIVKYYDPISQIFGFTAGVYYIVSVIVVFGINCFELVMTACFFKDIAKMIEHNVKKLNLTGLRSSAVQ